MGRKTKAEPVPVRALTVTTTLTFDALLEAVAQLSIEEKRRLADVIDQQLFEEDDAWEQDPDIRAGVDQARAEYEAGDYISWEEYVASRRGER